MPAKTPTLPTAKARYLRRGMGRVNGWIAPSTAAYMSGLEVLQRCEGPRGDVCEIGIHHGLSFLCLATALPDGERAVAIDVFGNQQGNVDGSGYGDRRIFERNLARHCVNPAAVDIIEASSLDLHQLGFTSQGQRFRIFSIDGGHTAEITLNDLRIAEQTIVDGGLVILDDVLNSAWLGVLTGLFRYWSAGGTLVPAVMVPNKLILGTGAAAAMSARRLMAENFGAARSYRDVEFGDHTVDVYGEYPWVVADEDGGSGRLATPHGHPLSRRVAQRMPGLARMVRPAVRRLRARRTAR